MRGVSFELRAGEVLGIVGETGSGKTLTALSLAHLCRTRCGWRRRGWSSTAWRSTRCRRAG